MKRVIRIVGVGLAILVLIFSAWLIFEYQRLRPGIYKLASLPKAEMEEYRYVLGYEAETEDFFDEDLDKNYLDIRVIRAVYLGQKKGKCEDGTEKDVCGGLSFLKLDSQGNPVIFQVNGGIWDDEKGDYLVKMMVATDTSGGEEEAFAPLDLNKDRFLDLIEKDDLIELHVIEGVNVKSDFKTDDKILLGLMELFSSKEAKMVKLLARFQKEAEAEKGLIGLIKGFWVYRETVLPVYSFSVL